MFRFQFYIGTIEQLYRCADTLKVKNIIFAKKKTNLLTGESYAYNLINEEIYPYFRCGVLSNFNFKKFTTLKTEEQQIVTNGYSLNKYLKEKGYPLFINKETKNTILNTELSNIIENPKIVNYILKRESRYQNLKISKERKLSL